MTDAASVCVRVCVCACVLYTKLITGEISLHQQGP